MRNIVGISVESADFFERAKETGKIWNAIEAGKNSLLTGPRRMGKTSLLFHLCKNPKENYHFIYVDAESINNENELYRNILEKMLESDLAPRFRISREKLEHSISLLDKAGANGLPDFGPHLKTDETNAKEVFLKVIKSIKGDGRLLIILDEFFHIAVNIIREEGESEAVRFLKISKDVRQKAPANIQFIYAGPTDSPYLVKRLDSSRLMNDLCLINISPFTMVEARRFVKELLKNKNFHMKKSQVEYLLDMIQWLIPFHIQWFLQEIDQVAIDEKLSEITNNVIESTFSRMSKNNSFLGYLHSSLKSTFNRQEHGFVSILLDELSTRTGISSDEIETIAVKYGVQDHYKSIVQFLDQDGYLQYDSDSAIYHFKSNLIKTWWRREKVKKTNGDIEKGLEKLNHAPVVLHSLGLKNLRAIETLEIRFPSRRRTRGQWTIFLGDNGVGKTTVLQALALASLAERQQKAAIAGSIPAPLMRHGAQWTSIDLQCGRQRYSLKMRRSGASADQLDGGIHDDKPPYLVFGYGCGRGSALGGPDRAVELERRIDGVATLFGLPSFLIHGETWLRSLEHAALKSSSEDDKAFFEAARKTVLGLLPGVDEMEIGSDRIWLRGRDVGECTLSGLSDGYITTLGWSLDLIARWAHEAKKSGAQLDGSFNEKMTGLVLIDELDLHLHPRWQTRVIADIRKAFPKMSFVVTTHNPLTLLSAKAREVHVLERDEEGGIICNQVDPPPGIRADQVLTGPWFGLSSTLDRDTLRMLDKHRRMLRSGAERNVPERKELERKIRQRLGSYADTSEERLALEVAAKARKSDKPLDHRERARLQREVKELLKVKR